MTEHRCSFVIVTYNNMDTIEMCLRSVADWTSGSYDIVVVDNSPDRRTLEAIERFIASSDGVRVRTIKPVENIGFSRACNMGGREAQGDLLFFLNPDAALLNDAVKLLAGGLDQRPLAMAAGPAIVDQTGRVTRTCRNLPTLGRILLDATGVDRWCGAYKLMRFRHDHARRVEQIIGAAMMVRRSDYERLGGMDERFFVYFEEVDFCKRIKDAGGEIWFWPDARVQHLAGRSCEADSVRARMIFVLRESRRKYFRKHFGAVGGTVLEVINRVEAVQKAAVLAVLAVLGRKRSYREKAYGFWSVAIGIGPRV
jgi:N-acetylglucosaminyl-diphospho-decaprenol L-rhamnosyltransferase